jgi:CcmD family protein
MSHFLYLFAAYTVVWTVLFLYVLSLDRRSRRAERELEDLKRIIEGALPKPASPLAARGPRGVSPGV